MMFLLRRPAKQASYDQLTVNLADEQRLSTKRHRMIESQMREIERLTSVNARLASLLLEHRDCPHRPNYEAALVTLLAQEARV